MKFVKVLIFVFLPLLSFCQEDEKNWDLTGYVKNLQTIYNLDLFGQQDLVQDNLLHNRLNFKYYLNDQWTFKLDLRNRIFYGNRSIFLQNFDEDAGNDFVDLSGNIVNSDGLLWHAMIDRLYFEYASNDWEIRIGRQRINWGINTVWNPNDIFNAFNFADFDYEERPGSDAIRITHYTGPTSSVELAINVADSWDELVVGGLWKFNKGDYDFQLLSGFFQNDIVIGGGWAGNIKNASIKGELAYFAPLVEEREKAFAGTLAVDYSFNKGLYLNIGFLFNSSGVTTGGLESLFTSQLSAKNLYPFKYAIFTQVTQPLSPLLSIGIANIYSPSEGKALFFNPTITYSISDNWDLTIVGQLMFNQGVENYESPIQAFFLRFRYSF